MSVLLADIAARKARRAADLQLAQDGPCPSCWRRERCAQGGIACEAFAMFYVYGEPERWRLAPRQPTRAIFERVLACG